MHPQIANLGKIRKLNMEKCNIVQWYNAFEDKGHICLEFENLDKSLYHLLTERKKPFILSEIRPIVQQVCAPLVLLAVTEWSLITNNRSHPNTFPFLLFLS